MPDPILTRNDRWKLFAREYLIDLNGTRAALAAGYSKKAPEVVASRLLRQAKVQKELKRLLTQREKNLDISADHILEELARLGFSNMMDFMRADQESGEMVLDFSNLTREQAAAIQEYTIDSTGGLGDGERLLVRRTRFKLAPKTEALKLLGQYRKLFTELHEMRMFDGVAELLQQRRAAAKAE